MKKLTLEDMTKAELLRLLRRSPYYVEQRDLLRERWKSQQTKATELLDLSIEVGKELPASNGHMARFEKSQMLWHRHLKADAQAAATYDELMKY